MNTPTSKPASPLSRLRKPRGQAMVEYTVIAHFMLMGGAFVLLPLFIKMVEKLGVFYDSVYFVIERAAL
jgi:hypothetical protein